ncbi:NmrA-like family domain-containing protein 1 [Mycena venus]|uniref:NmrA-like family domain-containing protein 1 n=1 Tax=Mycena venus TaxID=2733690 RepID=A0A8H6XHB9_9AGAR|nr:NmrA-like family domain-containing protein 1 [Mycena venus]
MSASKKLILVIGATGAQGQAVIDALLAPDASGQASSYTIRALTRDPSNPLAQKLAQRGVECVKGSFMDFASVAHALEGCYGAWVNTDGFTVGEMEEIYAGMRIYEVAKRVPSLRHYVWSNVRYVLKNANYNPDYAVDHMNAKGRVGEWLSVQPSSLEDGLTWSQVTTGPYMDMLKGGLFTPLNVRKDGTVVFASPLGDGHVPMIALKDLGWWARYTFDHRAEVSGRELNVNSECVQWDDLVKTFTKVTGKPAVYKRLTMDEFFDVFDPEWLDAPVASDKKKGDGSKTIRQNFQAFLTVLRDDIVDKDMGWIRSVHPGTYTLERWMRENEYNGRGDSILKNTLDGKMSFGFRPEIAVLL